MRTRAMDLRTSWLEEGGGDMLSVMTFGGGGGNR